MMILQTCCQNATVNTEDITKKHMTFQNLKKWYLRRLEHQAQRRSLDQDVSWLMMLGMMMILIMLVFLL